MKNSYRLNTVSKKILEIGGLICLLAYFGVFLHTHHMSKQGYINTSEISLMLEYVSMALVIVVISALIWDIHIKRNDK